MPTRQEVDPIVDIFLLAVWSQRSSLSVMAHAFPFWHSLPIHVALLSFLFSLSQSYSTSPGVTLDCDHPESTSGNCEYYEHCVESHIPCQREGFVSYAMKYGKVYCELFAAHRDSFSPSTQEWIDCVMTCLQTSLSPRVLRAISSSSSSSSLSCGVCVALEQHAYSTHSVCYVSCGVCSLPLLDFPLFLSLICDDFLCSNQHHPLALLEVSRILTHCLSSPWKYLPFTLLLLSLLLSLLLPLLLLLLLPLRLCFSFVFK
jgi:hypothetical protein